MSIVNLLLFALTLKSWNFPPFSRCVPPPWLVSDELEMLDSATERKTLPECGSCHCTSSRCLSCKKKNKTVGRNSLRSVSPPRQTIRHRETKTFPQGRWFILLSEGFPCFNCILSGELFLDWKFTTEDQTKQQEFLEHDPKVGRKVILLEGFENCTDSFTLFVAGLAVRRRLSTGRLWVWSPPDHVSERLWEKHRTPNWSNGWMGEAK